MTNEVKEQVVTKTKEPAVDDKQVRIEALESQVALLQEAAVSLNEQVRKVIDAVSKPAGYSVGGFTFEVKSLPKQDAMVAGANSVGRPGLVLEANDGDRTFVLAKVEWDHLKQSFVLYSGKGVQ